jgi:hypothetical protein
VQPERSWVPGIEDGIRGAFALTSVEVLNFVVPSDELRRKPALRRRKDDVSPYAGRMCAAKVGSPEQLGARMRAIHRRHLLFFLGAASAALVLSLGAAGRDAAAYASAAKPHKLTKHEKAVARRSLRRALKRNPQAVLRGGFLQKAQAIDLTLPLTLRLGRAEQTEIDDELAVEWTSETFPWPAGYAELQPATGDPAPGGVIPLDGTSSLEAEFGNDVSGYAGPGVVETLAGGKVAFDSGQISPAIAVSDYAQTVDDNVPLCHAPTIQMSNVVFGTGRATQSLLHLFGGTARVTLHVQAGTTTQLVAPTCVGGFGTTGNTHAPASVDPIVPISFDATFKVSPAVTADGKLRLGVLTVPVGSVQPTTFARITMCVDEATPCTTRAFPSRLKVLQLNAEVLVGDYYA